MRKLLAIAVLALAVVDVVAGATLSEVQRDQSVSRFIVLMRSDNAVTSRAKYALPDAVVRAAQNAGVDLSAAGASPSGGQILTLAQPIGIGEAKQMLGRLRMMPGVIWAELDPTEFETVETKAARQKKLEGVTGISQLIVTLTDENAKRSSRANEMLASQWDDQLSQAAGLPLRILRPMVGSAWIVALPSQMTYADAAAVGDRLTSSGLAVYADPDAPIYPALTPNDPFFNSQWSLGDPFSTKYVGINAPQAWDITTGDPNMVVAVVDMGVLPHPEFASRLLQGYDFVSNPANSNDGLGPHASGTDPGNWHAAGVCSAPNNGAANSEWHGTHVTGIIAATGNNGIGIAGINWQAKILPVRVLGTCGGTTSDILTGMLWAAGLPVPGVPNNPNPARVINMSLGGPGECTPQYQAYVNEVLATGSLVVAAAGNDDGIADNKIPGACFGLSTVGSTGPYGDRAPYSNFSFTLDISAPGGDSTFGQGGEIYSTLNQGTTTPAGYDYMFDQGTSMAAPQVTGVASLMLAINPSLTPAQLKQLMADNASPFAPGSACQLAVCGAGIVNAYLAVAAAAAAATPNYTGLFWNSPAGSESGWGINVEHQGNIIFATWFTYDLTGKFWWLSMTANQTANKTFSGTLYQTNGPAFNAVPFNPAAVKATPVGTGTLTFSDGNDGTFAYTVNGISQVKSITRQVFGAVPKCVWGAQPNLALATNVSGLWWAAPPGVEAGWGINFSQQGNIIFATWFTYNGDGTPAWLSVTATNTAPGVYTGALYVTSGPAFDAVPFLPADVSATQLGIATFTFFNGNSGSFSYTVNTAGGPVTQTKSITQQVFAAPGTVCQ